MLGSPCSPCCNICGIDWSRASTVELEIESTDYYARWHARSQPSFGTLEDYYISVGFLGSRYSGTFELNKTFDDPVFGRSEWSYTITNSPQLCALPDGRESGLYVELYRPSNFFNRAASVRVVGSNQVEIVRGAESYTNLADMVCSLTDNASLGFGGTPTKNGDFLQGTGLLPCNTSVERIAGGFSASDIPMAPSLDPSINGGSVAMGGVLDRTNWTSIEVPSNTSTRQFIHYGGFYPAGIGPQPSPPPFRNIRLVSSTKDEPYEWPSSAIPNDYFIKMSSVFAIKRLTVRL